VREGAGGGGEGGGGGGGSAGLEPVHRFSGGNFSLKNDSRGFVGQGGGGDTIYWHNYQHQAKQVGFPEMEMYEFDRRFNPVDPRNARMFDVWDVKFSSAERRAFSLGAKGVIGAFFPSIFPRRTTIAFIRLNHKGT